MRLAERASWKRLGAVLMTIAIVLSGAVPTVRAAGEPVEVWVSTSDPSRADGRLSPTARLTRKADAAFGADTGFAAYTVRVDEDVTRQQMDGFGVSFTDASAWLLNYKLDAAKRAEVMERLFGRSGIGMSILRQPIGASDFNWEAYTYADTPTDASLSQFSIGRDLAYIVPMVKQARSVNPAIKVFGATWSPPAWMKYSNSLNGGKLRAEHYPTFANYLVKFVQSYQAQGIPIYAVTPQNEPMYETTAYPSMGMSIQDQVGFIGDYLGPAFAAAGLNTKIISFDHNYLDWNYPDSVIASLKNAGKGHYVAGAAFHHYDSGDGSQMTQLHNAHPDKDVWFTEGGFGTWNDPEDGTHNGFDNMANEFINMTRNWSKSIILWNAALDERSGPTLLAPNNSNRGMLTIRNSDNRNDNPENQVTYNKQYYLLGHFSKFVVPGAHRVESNTHANMRNVAFKNPDGSKVLVAYNPQTSQQSLKVQWGKQAFVYQVPGKSMVTFKWNGVPTWDKVSIQANANNLYVTAENGGASPLIANRSSVGTWETFERVVLSNGRIALKALANGKYVTAENGGADPLVARSAAIGTWEMFEVANVSGGVSIRADANGRFVCAENGGANALIANRDTAGGWETFRIAVVN